jgi:hypothetical protein
MELRETGPQQAILDPRQDPVSGELVERHPSPEGGARRHHPRPHHHVGLAGENRHRQLLELFRRVLSVAVKQHHGIKTVIYGVLVADLLVAAIALVDRIEKDLDVPLGVPALVLHPDLECPILRRVVDDQDAGVVLPHRLGNTVEDRREGTVGVVGDDEDEEALFAHH